jgi:DNA polymerase-3 subunit epsilon
MRQVVLDTETTGLDPALGHRIIEVGCVEVINRRITERVFHRYLNPGREVDAGALQVHGITNEFLADKPRFADVIHDLLSFLHDAEVLIHNASFDLAFLNSELQLVDASLGTLDHYCRVTDTLAIAREKHPGKKNGLDALCRQYGIDNSHRELHGALLDAQLLAEVYLAMTGGQTTLTLVGPREQSPRARSREPRSLAEGHPLRVVRASAEEAQAHASTLARIDKASGGRCLWSALDW